MSPAGTHLFLQTDLDEPLVIPCCGGRVAVYTHKTPAKERPNEDGALLIQIDGSRGVLAVADGAGGQVGGGRAAAIALEMLQEGVGHGERSIREDVLNGFEAGNGRVLDLKVGAATTLAAVEISVEAEGTSLRSYHVGDSEVLLVGQRGRRKFQSISHSPVSYAVEAGMLDEDEALHHEERHVVSNLLGAETIHIDMSAKLTMARRDTLLIASDGLFDNLQIDEIVDLVRTGTIELAAGRLLNRVRARMRGGSTQPSKPDDVTFLLYRRS